MYFDNDIYELLQNSKSIAIVGAKDKPNYDVDRVGRYLLDMGYVVFPVHPKRKNVWGLKTYKSLLDVPEHIDIINIFRQSSYCILHAQEVLLLKDQPKVFWMQSGIHSLEAKELLLQAGIAVVENACVMLEHRRLLGS